MPAYDYDIVASFPSVARNLIDIRHCAWMHSKVYQDKACYGYVKCIVTIYPETVVSPIIHIDEKGNSTTPTGTWETCLTKGELDFIDKWKIGKYKILDGWWSVAEKKVQPLAVIMDRLLAHKEKKGLIGELAKRMSVGVYGKFLELHKDGLGKHFNPCWGAEIGTTVRLQVAEWLYKHKIGPNENEGYKHLLHISVDGALLDKEVKL